MALAQSGNIMVGAERSELYLNDLKGKSVGVVGNQTSILPGMNNMHLVDYLLSENINVAKVFVPEHGFRGQADAGEVIDNSVDEKTGLPIVSLYGSNKKPSSEQLEGLDIIIFDLQDVGTRFYTYISTMHYIMEAGSENGVEVMVMDRPNPNGDYVDGPIRKEGFKSFVGMHPVPIVHGLTVGELAQMINGEMWLKDGIQADLTVIPIENWNHSMPYSLPVKPSPNLPNDLSIRLYPSTCFFEGTNFSVGRGTYFPFQVYGYPNSDYGDFEFTPVSINGMAKSPRYQDQTCYGVDLRNEPLTSKFTLSYILDAYNRSQEKDKFFTNWFNTLAGTDELMKMIKAGKSEEEIRASWKKELDEFKKLREKYLIYN
ncbi:exo-beta-N-acetylmuramidase NamZ family protein [Algoriphagus sediminis]|uniref:DUF1343 domain-containing protein n=1 Tax=Algoriphagus sediminis TaxID=3057113 RepID=A0ABT7YAJ9_9BACT|nr:DUF1343 domain-containing protein [Algoriphagus sediminis]MDN3203529.1 DUF1343 domain-containing protein [Algoriphagus sediminis]